MRRLQFTTLLAFVALMQAAVATNDPRLSELVEMVAHKDYPAAVAQCQKLLKSNQPSDPQNPRICYMLACCYYYCGQFDYARTVLNNMIKSYPRANETTLASKLLSQINSMQTGLPPSDRDSAGSTSEKAAAGADAQKATPSSTTSGKRPADAVVSFMAGGGLGRGDAAHMPAGGQYVFNDAGNYDSDFSHDKLAEQTRIFYQDGPAGHMIVNGWINNHPLQLWFDTGATAHLGKNNLRDVGITPPSGKPDGWTSGWAGRPVPIWHMVADVRLGDMTRRLPILVEDSYDLPPLIGTDFTRGYEVGIDRAARCITLKREHGNASKEQLDSLYDLPCRTMGHDVLVQLQVGNKQCEALIDTGAANTILSPITAEQLGIEIPFGSPTYRAGGVGGTTVFRQVNLDLRLGPIKKEDFPVMIGGAAGNAIGQDFMSGWRFTVDRDKHLVRFFH